MPFAFAVVCEAEADFRTATGLAERIIREHADWVEDYLPTCPLWHGADQTRPYLHWTDIEKLANAAGIKVRGHFDGQPGEADARNTRRVLLLLKKWKLEVRSIDGVLLIRDDDRDKQRRVGLEQGRDAVHELRDRVVIGLAHCKRECWVLAGFDPLDSDEKERLDAVRSELGFDPRNRAHELTAKHDADRRSAKRVLGILTHGNVDREEKCWKVAPLSTLLERGRETGLEEFLNEVTIRLIPLFASGRTSSGPLAP